MAIGRSEALQLVEAVMELSSARQTEAVLIRTDTALTRYANSIIHQNVASRNATLIIRLVFDKRIGTVSTNKTDVVSLKAAVERAEKIAKAQKPNKDFVSLPEPRMAREVQNFSARTENSTPEDRAEVVGDIVSQIAAAGVDKAFGALEATTSSVTVANSLGVRAHDEMTVGHLVINAIAERGEDKGYGWSEDLNVDVSKIDHLGMARRAAEKAVNSLGAKPIKAGEYEVVLESYAVANMIQFLDYIAFGALPYQEGRSCISGKLGEKVTGDSITLWDEGSRPQGLPLSFDAEGVPKERVSLMEDGIAKSVVYDSYTAGREGRVSTGHALPQPNPSGPLAVNSFLKVGDSDLGEMIGDTERGVYISRFHYTNAVDAPKALITGMTRDGTFLIEDGEITGPLKNLRFTQGILEALAEASLIGESARPHRFSSWLGWGATTVPDLKIDRFRFTGATEF